jgi:hypothetical protein
MVVVVCAVWVGLGARYAEANNNPGVVPIDGSAQRAVYGNLAAAWWQWATETPTNKNALVDTTGKNCASNQTGSVWFLAGTLDGSSVTRTCTVPQGTYLFFPLSNDFYGAFLTDPADQRTEDFVRSQVECIEGAIVTATIDGVPVNNPQHYLETSSLFSIQLPKNNVFGVTAAEVPKLTLSPVADEGYYLYLYPLAPGYHTIHFTAAPARRAGARRTPRTT